MFLGNPRGFTHPLLCTVPTKCKTGSESFIFGTALALPFIDAIFFCPYNKNEILCDLFSLVLFAAGRSAGLPPKKGVPVRIRYYTHTEIGDRPCNEDRFSVCQTPSGYCFALADGLGGLDRGEVAAELACRTVTEYAAILPEVSNQKLEQMFWAAQQAILERQHAEHNETQMKTTLNVVLVDRRSLYWGHVGDSRTYYAENGRLQRRTFDHSVTQMLSAIGQVADADIRFHEDRSKLLRVLGTPWTRSQVELEPEQPLRGSQQLLLCTDGFWEYITEEQIQICLEESDNPRTWMENMLELISRNDHHSERDNRTAITVWIDDEKGGAAQ